MSVMERHGCTTATGGHSVTIDEREGRVRLVVRGLSETSLTPDEARYLAGKLRRCAQRVEIAEVERELDQ